ncbi:MAG: hypothetical protein OEZ43_19830 [Gammaproteobacteria bacterium]|nr:hypothetical protein [Gammaproteobacteria bacterium]
MNFNVKHHATKIFFGILILFVFAPTNAAERDNVRLYGSKPFFGSETIRNYVSWNNTYKLNYDLDSLRQSDGKCNDGDKTSALAYAGRGSIFHTNTRDNKDELLFIEFEYVAPAENPPKNVAKAEINKPYFLCRDRNITSPNYYRQVGGLNTGVLIIPLKIRTDLTMTGAASIGPYFGLSNEKFTLLAAVGLSQLPILQNSVIENRTGLTAAVGINWRVQGYFNLGVVAGIDHLPGGDQSTYAYQDKPWLSFAVGYTFSR